MNLAAKYNRTELIRDGEIQAWKGVERSTGEAVVLYLYAGEVSGGQPLSEYARGSLAKSLGTGETEVDGGVFGLSPCMVARLVKVGASAEAPARAPEPPVFSAPPPIGAAAPPQHAEAPASRIPQPPISTTPADGAFGDFTAMFGAAVAGKSEKDAEAGTPATPASQPAPVFTTPPPEAPPPEASQPEAPAPAAPVADAAVGEFTSLFHAAQTSPAPKPATDALPETTPPAADAGPAKPAAPPHPGVFTSLYMAANPADVSAEKPAAEPVIPEAPAAPKGPAAPPGPGVFTSLYMAAAPESTPESPSPETSPVPQASFVEPAAEPVVAAPEVGEFTSLFMAAKPPEQTPQQTVDTPVASTEAPSTPATPSTPPAFARPDMRAESLSAEQDAPGEFTMAFQSADLPAPAAKDTDEAILEASSRPSIEPVPPASSFDETAELEVGDSLPSIPPADGPAIQGAPLVPPAVEEIRSEEPPGEFTRLFEAAPEDDATSKSDATPPESPNVVRDLTVPEPEVALTAADQVAPQDNDAGTTETAGEEAERFSSASPAKGPIRFVASDKPTPDDASKPPRSPLQSGSFSQTYVSTNEMPVMREPILGVPAPATPAANLPPASGGDAPGEFTMLFASPGGAVSPPAALPPQTAPVAPATPAPLPEPVAAEAAAPAKLESPAASPSTQTPAAPGEGPGEFTKFFQPGEVDKIKQEVAAMTPTPPGTAPAKPAQEQPIGEFTRMFSAAEMASKAEKPKDPGVFTNLYLAADSNKPEIEKPAAPAASAAPPSFTTPAPAPADAGGSFTSMFRAAEGGVVPSEPTPASADIFMPPPTGAAFGSPQPPSGSEEPSFTRYFQAGDLSASPVAPQHQDVVAPSPDLPAYSSGYSKGATSFFQAVPESAAPAAPVEQGPGEYTRMISGDEVKQAMAGPGGQQGASAPGASGGGGGVSMPIGVPMSAPSVSGPYVQGPHMSGPQMSGPQISSSGISAPHLQGPHMSGPQMSGPHVQGPHMATPHLQTPHMQVPPVQAGGGSPVAPGQQAPAGGGASKIIIVATVLVTVIAVVLVLMVVYFMLGGGKL